MSRMNFAFLLFLALLCLVSSVQCSHGGQRFRYSLEKLIGSQRLRGSVEYVNEELEDKYTPVYVGPQAGLKEANKVSMLPGQPNGVKFDQYSGYVTVDPHAGRALFYYLAESENSSMKPLLLWLNGGPGCSSLIGAMSELGPFRPNKDGSLGQNAHAWNNVANILFLESPAGVGFSYSNRTSDYSVGDKRTAADAYTFLVNWLERFPEYKTRDFYISGESYAGHYVPELAQVIIHNNKITNQTMINIKGIIVGNAYIDSETRKKAVYDYAWSHALISDELYQGIASNCNFSAANLSKTCLAYSDKADDIIYSSNMDPYNIYAPLCLLSSNITPHNSISATDPCIGNYVFSYLNDPQVQKLLHANVTGTVRGPWGYCSDVNWEDQPDSVLPIIEELMTTGIRIWLYSGDIDNVVPVTSTRYALKKLGISIKTPWYPWNFQEEVGGFVEGYEHLTLVTVRGAGHMVPSDQPGRALAIFSSFLEGKLPPPSQN